ncbi:hypothetical protein CR162_18670 [Pseudoroseomonas rhizosphaerae]|uniref:DUF2491 domain-containing protein n=2 Tax=Teichococcus rhizosphaerae TaxID=1335062 RepID=A0A2C7A9X4_9PROT|nr:hypothetical protein CR162_18670 [Pseudoroseomonas rhizosphaerae]
MARSPVGMRARLPVGLLSLLLLQGPGSASSLPVTLALSAGVAGFSAPAEARPRSSGGYSRPGGSFRTPSVGGSGSYARPRTPSSGGYALPRSGGMSTPYGGGASAGDRSYNRAQAADALRRMRESQAAAERAARPAPMPIPSPSRDPRGGSGSPGGGYAGGYRTAPGTNYGGWYRDRGWPIPGTVLSGPRSFGIWDAAFLWFLFSTLNRPGHPDFFRNHQDDPGYREWRQEAERRAQSDPEVRAQLEDLDRRIAEKGDQPRDPSYLPPGVPAEVATGAEGAELPDRRTPTVVPVEQGGQGIPASVVGVVMLGGGLLAVLAWRRRTGPRSAGSRPGGAGGMGQGGTLASAASMLRHKTSGGGYAPSRFRVGMTLTLDPTPFLLAAGATHLSSPRGAGEMISVEEVGRIGGDVPGGLVRLYLPSDRAMLQLHLGENNKPDECRYFALLDEVTPADEAEWGAWLDPREGMIGWPEFQTKDGKIYARAWSPGQSRVQPRQLAEEVDSASGQTTVISQSMLYAAPTGLAMPAPQTEYILVSAIEDGGQAWVEIRAGLDINPASLSLA